MGGRRVCLRMSAAGDVQVAGNALMWRNRGQGGHLLLADCARLCAPCMKPTSRGRIDRIGGVAREGWNLGPVVWIHRGDRRQQCLRIRVAGICEQRFAVADLDHFAQVHDHHPVRHVAHDVQVVADENVGEAETLLEVLEQVEYLGFDGFVERRDGLVQNNQARIQCECARNIDPLSLAARQFMGIAPTEPDRVQSDPIEQILSQFARIGAGDAVDLGAKRYGVENGQARIERRKTILENDLRLPSEFLQWQLPPTDGLAIKYELTTVGGRELHE